MFELNPLGQPDAWWQHILMVVVAAVVGYIIGYRSGKYTEFKLEEKVESLDVQLLKCLGKKVENSKGRKRAVNSRVSDNLKMIEGVGPKIEQLLRSNGINSFVELSHANVEHITDILRNAGTRYQMHDPSTWPRQAALAAKGEWGKLKEWQDELDKGRE